MKLDPVSQFLWLCSHCLGLAQQEIGQAVPLGHSEQDRKIYTVSEKFKPSMPKRVLRSAKSDGSWEKSRKSLKRISPLLPPLQKGQVVGTIRSKWQTKV